MFIDKQMSNGSLATPMLPPPSSPPDTQQIYQEQVLRQLATNHPNGSILQVSAGGYVQQQVPQNNFSNYSPGSSAYSSPGVLTPQQFSAPYQQVPLSPIVDNRMVQGAYPMGTYKTGSDHPSFYARAVPQGYQNTPYNKEAVNMYSAFPGSFQTAYSVPQQISGGVMGVTGRIPLMTDAKMMKSPKRTMQQEQLSANRERTIYISDVDHNVTEEDLAKLFSRCGDVVDCRLCGDAHSRMRFAFVEFSSETWRQAVPEALKLNDTPMCGVPIRILRSKTAIIPVKRELLPRSEEEMERCQRTIYVSNIDKRLTEIDVKTFFQALSVDSKTGADGKIHKVRLLGDNNHNTSIAFIEFFTPESAITALNKCQGALMGCLPLRVSPSKTPVRTLEEDRALREAQRAARFP